MSYLRNFEKVVSSQLFTKPNNLRLRSCVLPTYLCLSPEPIIDHVHSARALVKTVKKLQSLGQNQTLNKSYAKEIQQELQYLNFHLQNYQGCVRRYVENGGNVTAEGISCLYGQAESLGLTKQWLKTYVQASIPEKINYMTRQNLVDTIDGLRNYQPNSEHLSALESALNKTTSEEPEYVNYLPHETTEYEYVDNSDSNHELIRAIQANQSYVLYSVKNLVCKAWVTSLSLFNKDMQTYKLHNE